MNRSSAFYILLVFTALLHSCASQKKTNFNTNFEDALLWKVSGNGIKNPSFLFGTIHVLCKEDMPNSENIQEALAQSNEMYLEVDLTDTLQMMKAMGSMMMKDNEKLSNLLSKEEYLTLSDEFKKYGLGISTLERMQPLLLSGLILPKWLDCTEQSGVEIELLKWAKQGKKKVNGLETLADQLKIFSNIPYQKQAEELYKTLTDSSQKGKMQELYQAYLKQELTTVAKIMNSEPQMEEFKEALLTNRNKNWVSQLNTIMPSKSVFVAVGAGHLLETDGIIFLLREKGYNVVPVLD